MTIEDIFEKISNTKRGYSKNERTPHKPLLILLAIKYLFVDKQKLIKYSEIEGELGGLLEKYGKSITTINPHQPFWRLEDKKDSQNGIWRIVNKKNVRETSSDDARVSDLKKYNTQAGFTKDVIYLLEKDESSYKKLIQFVLDKNFPNSIHNEILKDVGLNLRYTSEALKRKRDHKFREKVLKTYDYKCVVCGYDLRFFNESLALEAAHIKWHVNGGPDFEENGLALCSIHHKLFDMGAIGIDTELKLLISDKLQGSHNNLNPLLSMHKELINVPNDQNHYPKEEYINWHHQKVFKKKNKK